MRKWIVGALTGAVALGGGAFAGMTIAGPSGIGEPRELAEPAVAEPVTGTAARETRARARGGRATIDFFYAADDIVPANGEGLVQPIRCPRSAGNPIGGGARTGDGIVIAYLSRANPATGNTPPRTYFVGVEDVDVSPDTNPGAGALIEVQCAKGMRVRD
jgi:hypothetical protein